MSCQLLQIYILFPFQDPQDDHPPSKRCRLATHKRPAYEPVSGRPSPKRSAPCGEELEDTIRWSITDEEERLNLVSSLLTIQVTVSVLIIAWH